MKWIFHYNNPLIILGAILLCSCSREEWEEHYNNYEEHVNMELWDAVREEPRYSNFVEYMEEYRLDSLFESELSFTLFIPDNDALESLNDTTSSVDIILANHISETVFMTRNVETSRKVQTLRGKFAIIDRTAAGYTYEGQLIEYSSPLYLDGKFYEIAEIAYPRLKLYEYITVFCPTVKEFINNKDSVYLDKSLSTAVSFDEHGNTIYDSIFGVVNIFERDYFAVSQEHRDKSATLILFTQEQYNDALDEMAGILGAGYNNHEDIPGKWQSEVLLPDILNKSLFYGILNYSDFKQTMVNIAGDTVVIDPGNINPDSKYRCSNGLVYSYYGFMVPSDLYHGIIQIEGEELIDSIGVGRYAWKEDIIVSGYLAEPVKNFSLEASEKYLLNIALPRRYDGIYTVSFQFINVFPMKYRLEWRANNRPSGNYAVYINDQMIGEFDTYELRSVVISVTGESFIPEGGYNSKDWWVDNITEFGDVTVRIEYLDPGSSSSNGLNIDYVALIPALGQ